MRTITVEVTAEDIALRPEKDPLRVALERLFPGDLISLGYFSVAVAGKFDVRLPMRVSTWSRDCDEGKPVEPITFELQIED